MEFRAQRLLVAGLRPASAPSRSLLLIAIASVPTRRFLPKKERKKREGWDDVFGNEREEVQRVSENIQRRRVCDGFTEIKEAKKERGKGGKEEREETRIVRIEKVEKREKTTREMRRKRRIDLCAGVQRRGMGSWGGMEPMYGAHTDSLP
eukprot:1424234-Rhodomonas_salina.1